MCFEFAKHVPILQDDLRISKLYDGMKLYEISTHEIMITLVITN